MMARVNPIDPRIVCRCTLRAPSASGLCPEGTALFEAQKHALKRFWALSAERWDDPEQYERDHPGDVLREQYRITAMQARRQIYAHIRGRTRLHIV